MENNIYDILVNSPIIAATDSENFATAADSKAEIIFHLKADILTLKGEISAAKAKGKKVFVHIDLAEGVGKDRSGILWLKKIGADGIISTRTQLIHSAHECDMYAVQRFFVLDTKGMTSITETIKRSEPDFIEIMPGVIPKALSLFSSQCDTPVIAGGLIENKAEITAALSNGALAVSTGKKQLWNIL